MRTPAHDRALEMDLAERLTERRKELAAQYDSRFNPFNQKAIAEKIGIHRVNLCQWETGAGYPSTWSLWRRWGRAVSEPTPFDDMRVA